MPRKKLIISGRLGDFSNASLENADRVVLWISQRFLKWETTGETLGIRPSCTPHKSNKPGNPEETLSVEKKAWDKIRERWNAIWRNAKGTDRETLRENYQSAVRDIRAWIEEKLTDAERVRMLAALRQQRFQKRNAKSIKSKTITIRIDRDVYEAAMDGLPDGNKTRIVIQLLQRFANDEALKHEILGELAGPNQPV
jgi:hypothetical protein